MRKKLELTITHEHNTERPRIAHFDDFLRMSVCCIENQNTKFYHLVQKESACGETIVTAMMDAKYKMRHDKHYFMFQGVNTGCDIISVVVPPDIMYECSILTRESLVPEKEDEQKD